MTNRIVSINPTENWRLDTPIQLSKPLIYVESSVHGLELPKWDVRTYSVYFAGNKIHPRRIFKGAYEEYKFVVLSRNIPKDIFENRPPNNQIFYAALDNLQELDGNIKIDDSFSVNIHLTNSPGGSLDKRLAPLIKTSIHVQAKRFAEEFAATNSADFIHDNIDGTRVANEKTSAYKVQKARIYMMGARIGG